MSCKVYVTNGSLDEKEIDAYLDRAREKFGMEPESMTLTVDGEEVEIEYQLPKRPFHRIRRITGYLVGTLDRFNDSKRYEERDRIKHECG